MNGVSPTATAGYGSFTFQPASYGYFGEVDSTLNAWGKGREDDVHDVHEAIRMEVAEDLKSPRVAINERIWLHLCRNESDDIVGMAWIDTSAGVARMMLALNPMYQGRGVAEACIQYVEGLAPNKKMSVLVANSLQSVYADLGFKPVETNLSDGSPLFRTGSMIRESSAAVKR